MYIATRIFCLYFIVNLLFCFDIKFNLSNFSLASSHQPISYPHIIAIMVEFEPDNSPLTSGDGLFLDSLDIDMIWNPDLVRCDQFIVDRPPHDSIYFSSQIKALSSYYHSISNGNINISGHVISNSETENGAYRLNKKMELYSYSDEDLSRLFKESLDIAKDDIENYLMSNPDINFNDVIFTVFHAGIGQDFSFPTFDPAIYDIKSAYIEPTMFGNVNYPVINNNFISSGILLPETQNMIFFNSIEDIFYGDSTYCDYQLGMTGTFSFLMGYALGLPPLFNTETGDPGIGIFGLMDYGSNNGRGIIPSLPSPWTRILKNWTTSINMTNDVSTQDYLVFNTEPDNIYRFDVSDYEYFLIENKSNILSNGESLTDIVSDYNGPYNDQEFPNGYSNWFDAIISANDICGDTLNIFEFSGDSVITKVIDYDLGLPNSGLLVWHIDESYLNLNNGINNNVSNRAVAVEEGDGALDIGFESYALFSNDDPTSGTKWDFWYRGNEAYHYANNVPYKCFNPETYALLDIFYVSECINNGGIWLKTEVFDTYSRPNSHLNDNSKSFFSFEILDSISNTARIKARYVSSIPYLDFNYDYDKVLGTSDSFVYYGENINNSILELNMDSFLLNNTQWGGESDIYNQNSIILTGNNNIPQLFNIDYEFAYLDPLNNNIVPLDNEFWLGHFLNTDSINELTYQNNSFIIDDLIITPDYYPYDGISIADIDGDGLDEIIFVTEDGQIVAYNSNGTLVNGFPIGENYHGILLILSEKETDELVMVCRNLSHIELIWLDGSIISLPSLNQNSDIMVIANYLTDGSRYYNINSEASSFQIGDNNYWLKRYNNHSNYPLSSGIHVQPNYSSSNQDITNFYNYPNPIKDGKTKFRFFINSPTNDVDINIYNISGNKIDQLSRNNVTLYEYNEIEWNTKELLPGLYFAEIISSGNKQKIIKVVVGY